VQNDFCLAVFSGRCKINCFPPPFLKLLLEDSLNSPSSLNENLIRILLVDSSKIQCEVLSSALRRRPGFAVSCCAGDLSQCLATLESYPADVALLSDGTPGSGNEPYGILRGLHASFPKLGLVLLRDCYDRDVVVHALRCGARGLFCRACQPFKALCRCIYTVHKGQFWLNTEQLGCVIDALMWNPASRVVNTRGVTLLTPREEELAALVAEGLINRDIAHGLNITENTVKKGLLRIYDKLGVSNRVELVLYALTHREVGSSDSNSTALPSPSGSSRTASLPEGQRRSSGSGKRNTAVLDNVS